MNNKMTKTSIYENSSLYDIISELNLICTEEKAIRDIRKIYKPYNTYPLTNHDMNRLSYLYKHFTIPTYMKDKIEIWIGEERVVDYEYICDNNFEGYTHVYLHFDTDATEVSVRYNPYIIFNHRIFGEDNRGVYVLEMELNDKRLTAIKDRLSNVYYITFDGYKKPNITITDKTIKYECPYFQYMDFYIESNLIYCGDISANETVYIDDILSDYTYGAYIVDNNPDINFDARFYPAIKCDTGGFLRVYSDNCVHRPYPQYTRILNYAENMDYYDDPYNSPLADKLPEFDYVIDSSMSDNEILEIFAKISMYFYRWNEAPLSERCAPIFTVLNNNHKFDTDAFVKMTFHPTTYETKTAYISTFKYEDFSDVIMYKGRVIYNYFIDKVAIRNNEAWVDKLYGIDRYVIEFDSDINIEDLTVIKFHSYENTMSENLDPILDKNNLLHLHRKVNKFWHNIMAISHEDADLFYPDDQVWVGNTVPPTLDDHLWFELLSETPTITPIENNFTNWTKTNVTEIINTKVVAMNKVLDMESDLVVNTELKKVHWGEDEPNPETVSDNDIWIQWFDSIKDYITYSSETTLLVHVNERIYSVQFDEELDSLRVLAFDDIVLNFRNGDRCVRYLSILADLQQSGLVKPEDMVRFYGRLVTDKDNFDPQLKRIKTHMSNIVSEAQCELDDFTIIYGRNLVRQHWDIKQTSTANIHARNANNIDFTEDGCIDEHIHQFTKYTQTSNPNILKQDIENPRYILYGKNEDEQDSYYDETLNSENVLIQSGVIPYYCRDYFSYIPDKCLVFVNGIFIPSNKIEIRSDYRIAIKEFDQFIETVDIYYNQADNYLMKLIHCSEQYIPPQDYNEPILGYNRMEYIDIKSINYQGYYDLLRIDYFDNDKLLKIIENSTDEELSMLVDNMLEQFAPITYKGAYGKEHANRIIIYGGGNNNKKYQLFNKERVTEIE